MLIGYIGVQLQPFEAAPTGARAAAWSPDGQQIAFAAGNEVTITDWASRQSFSAVIPVSMHAGRKASKATSTDSDSPFLTLSLVMCAARAAAGRVRGAAAADGFSVLGCCHVGACELHCAGRRGAVMPNLSPHAAMHITDSASA